MAASPSDRSEAFERDGFVMLDCACSEAQILKWANAIERAPEECVSRRDGRIFGVRRLLDLLPGLREWCDETLVPNCISPMLGRDAFVVRALWFDKQPGANWAVPWHQDVTIAVRERREVAGFGPWSVKAGVPHVQPPVEILQGMAAVRLHLDDCGEENGPLRVIPGSHLGGLLDSTGIEQWRAAVAERECLMPRGGALLMRPLLLHASSPAKRADHRRVIHLEFASTPLPGGLAWYEQTAPDAVAAPSHRATGLARESR